MVRVYIAQAGTPAIDIPTTLRNEPSPQIAARRKSPEPYCYLCDCFGPECRCIDADREAGAGAVNDSPEIAGAEAEANRSQKPTTSSVAFVVQDWLDSMEEETPDDGHEAAECGDLRWPSACAAPTTKATEPYSYASYVLRCGSHCDPRTFADRKLRGHDGVFWLRNVLQCMVLENFAVDSPRHALFVHRDASEQALPRHVSVFIEDVLAVPDAYHPRTRDAVQLVLQMFGGNPRDAVRLFYQWCVERCMATSSDLNVRSAWLGSVPQRRNHHQPNEQQ